MVRVRHIATRRETTRATVALRSMRVSATERRVATAEVQPAAARKHRVGWLTHASIMQDRPRDVQRQFVMELITIPDEFLLC